ncbi:short transient receptor potential channel [Elysia marginata]|uniref:Short transient receptor potential channel n=1 Tax=Elysia marginata TaxID=1093978 RepID=A0AAV4IKT9_9GAST|nr:short transient receptor potential channel [Elysia marginata]
MTSIWYGSEMGFLQSLNGFWQFLYLVLFLPAIPFMCVLYIIAPGSKFGAIMRCPVTKFITHTTSHMCFLILLAAATFRITESNVAITNSSLLWIECKQIYVSGARSYIMDYYNAMDFAVLSMYLCSYVLRFFTEYKVAEADSICRSDVSITTKLAVQTLVGLVVTASPSYYAHIYTNITVDISN